MLYRIKMKCTVLFTCFANNTLIGQFMKDELDDLCYCIEVWATDEVSLYLIIKLWRFNSGGS